MLLTAIDPAIQTGSSTAAAVADPGREVVCKVVVLSGSRLNAKKYCGPRSFWDEYERSMRDWTAEMIDGSRTAQASVARGK